MYIAHIGSMYSRDLARQVNSNIRKGDSVTIFIFSVVHETLLCLCDITVFILSLTLMTSFKLKIEINADSSICTYFYNNLLSAKKKKLKNICFVFFIIYGNKCLCLSSGITMIAV